MIAGEDLVKRIVGIADDRVAVRPGGKLYINGVAAERALSSRAGFRENPEKCQSVFPPVIGLRHGGQSQQQRGQPALRAHPHQQSDNRKSFRRLLAPDPIGRHSEPMTRAASLGGSRVAKRCPDALKSAGFSVKWSIQRTRIRERHGCDRRTREGATPGGISPFSNPATPCGYTSRSSRGPGSASRSSRAFASGKRGARARARPSPCASSRSEWASSGHSRCTLQDREDRGRGGRRRGQGEALLPAGEAGQEGPRQRETHLGECGRRRTGFRFLTETRTGHREGQPGVERRGRTSVGRSVGS